jgi:hypothetical protein
MTEQKLWLWKNFVDGKQEYWAFDSTHPRHENGDPAVLGEPCGYALVKSRTVPMQGEVVAALSAAKVFIENTNHNGCYIGEVGGMGCVCGKETMEDLIDAALSSLPQPVIMGEEEAVEIMSEAIKFDLRMSNYKRSESLVQRRDAETSEIARKAFRALLKHAHIQKRG